MAMIIQIRNVEDAFAAFTFIPAGQSSKAWVAKVEGMLAVGEISEAIYNEYVTRYDAKGGDWVDVTNEVNFAFPTMPEVQAWADLRCATPTNAEDGSETLVYPFQIKPTALATLAKAELAEYFFTSTAVLK